MKETFFFSHDYNARNDLKLQKLIMTMGYEGLGIFWAVVEVMYENGGTINESELDSLAYNLRIDEKDKLIKIFYDFDLFFVKKGQIFSKSVQKRLKKRQEKSEKLKENAKKRWNKESYKHIEKSTKKDDKQTECNCNANAMQTECNCNAIKDNVVKDNVVKDNVVKDNVVKDNVVKDNVVKDNVVKSSKEKDTQGKTEQPGNEFPDPSSATPFQNETAKDKNDNGPGTTEPIADSSAIKQEGMSWSEEVDMAVELGIEQNLAMRICNLGRSNRLGFTRETYLQFVGKTDEEVNKTLDVLLVAAGKRKSGASGMASVSEHAKYKP